jgi:hypothetical protein
VDGQVTLTWIGNGVLEVAGAIDGLWTSVQPQPGSPFSITASGSGKFYRMIGLTDPPPIPANMALIPAGSFSMGECIQSWYPHPELNGNPRFRKPSLYPFELWGHMQARALELRAIPAGATDSRTLEPSSSTCKQLPSPPHLREGASRPPILSLPSGRRCSLA